MVHDKDILQTRPQVAFSHAELEHVYEAAKNDGDVPPRTLEKLKMLWNFSRTKNAYAKDQRKSATILTAS